MAEAIRQAQEAQAHEDVPVGAVVLDSHGEVVATGENRREVDQDPTAHAEIVALRRASEVTGNWHLDGCTLVVTLEPCMMCAGAIVLARVDRVVYGASDPKAGVVSSVASLLDASFLNHAVAVTGGVRAEACGRLLTDFFAARRSGRAAGRRRPPD
ncbi:tRNA adenosine(34) deaminase TadA [Euzebya tangerina]|uniref:tRNA adenosine(34) deaminase TadA n=1 Tax=Euzebya tangerina TaxID=591198 RepID=UPI000E31E12F